MVELHERTQTRFDNGEKPDKRHKLFSSTFSRLHSSWLVRTHSTVHVVSQCCDEMSANSLVAAGAKFSPYLEV